MAVVQIELIWPIFIFEVEDDFPLNKIPVPKLVVGVPEDSCSSSRTLFVELVAAPEARACNIELGEVVPTPKLPAPETRTRSVKAPAALTVEKRRAEVLDASVEVVHTASICAISLSVIADDSPVSRIPVPYPAAGAPVV